MTDRSIYISYRRSTNYALALALFHRLRAQNYDVFLDINQLDLPDDLDRMQIAARPHFLVIIAPALSESLQKPDDPVRCEIDQALSQRRNIVPLLANGFSFGKVALPTELRVLQRYYALSLSPETLDDAVATLDERLGEAQVFGKLVSTPVAQFGAVQSRIAEAERLRAPGADELRAEVIFNHALTRPRQDYEGKIADYDETLRLNPDHVYARFDRAVLRRRSGDESGAVEDYDEVLRCNPRFYKAYNNRAELFFARGYYRQALADYEHVTALRPTYTMSMAGKALTLHALGRVDEALRLWRPLLMQDERFYDAVWVGRELRLPTAMIDEVQRLTLRLQMSSDAPDD